MKRIFLLVGLGISVATSAQKNNGVITTEEVLRIENVLAGEMLGKKLIYMDAGSGAKTPVTEKMIHAVAQNIDVPLVVGGGIRDAEKAYLNCKAGADVIVIGNAFEKDPSLIKEIAVAVHSVPVNV